MARQTRSRARYTPQVDAADEARPCDMPGCPNAGEYRAPRSRDRLNDYYWFCLEHVQTYNRSWNYLAGMTDDQVETMLRSDTVWQRPSWPMGTAGAAREEALRHRIYRDFTDGGRVHFNGRADAADDDARRPPPAAGSAGEQDRALAILDLSWPVDFDTVKARYRTLAKRHHPDANNGSREAEEVLKSINQAYAVLRASFAP